MDISIKDWVMFTRYMEDHDMKPTEKEREKIKDIGLFDNPDYCTFAVYNMRNPDHTIYYNEDEDVTYLDGKPNHKGTYLRLSEEPDYIEYESDPYESIITSAHVLMLVTGTMPDSFYEDEKYDTESATAEEIVEVYEHFQHEASIRS